MIFAHRRAVRLGEHHTEEVVRLCVLRGDAHGVSGVALGFGEVPAADQKESELIRGPEIIGLEGDQASDERNARLGFSLSLADLVQDRKRASTTGSQLQHIERQALGLLRVPRAVGLRGALLQRHQVTAGLACPGDGGCHHVGGTDRHAPGRTVRVAVVRCGLGGITS